MKHLTCLSHLLQDTASSFFQHKRLKSVAISHEEQKGDFQRVQDRKRKLIPGGCLVLEEDGERNTCS